MRRPQALRRTPAAALMAICLGTTLPDARAQTSTPAFEEATIRKAIDAFLSDPLSDEGSAAARTIVDFAEKSDAVMIRIGPLATPWMDDDAHSEVHDAVATLLLGAFIAGNARAQLDSGVTADDTYSGLIQVFRVYRQLQTRNENINSPGVERYLEMHREGKLMAFLVEQEESEKSDE